MQRVQSMTGWDTQRDNVDECERMDGGQRKDRVFDLQAETRLETGCRSPIVRYRLNEVCYVGGGVRCTNAGGRGRRMR